MGTGNNFFFNTTFKEQEILQLQTHIHTANTSKKLHSLDNQMSPT
jgi:hypothetical protein